MMSTQPKDRYLTLERAVDDFKGEIKYVNDSVTREVMEEAVDVLYEIYDENTSIVGMTEIDGRGFNRPSEDRWVQDTWRFLMWMQEDLYHDSAHHRYGRYLPCLRNLWSDIYEQACGGMLAIWLNVLERYKQEEIQDPQSCFWDCYREAFTIDQDRMQGYGSHRSNDRWIYYDDVQRFLEENEVGGRTFAEHFMEWAHISVEPEIGGMHMIPGLTVFSWQLSEVYDQIDENYYKEYIPFHADVERAMKTNEFSHKADFVAHYENWRSIGMYINAEYTTLYVTANLSNIEDWYRELVEEWDGETDDDEDVKFYGDFHEAYEAWLKK